MRLLPCSLAALLLVVLGLGLGCSTVSPDECWPNTSGGIGGSGTIPIGAGVGATSGGDSDSPTGGTPNPCVTPSEETTPTPTPTPSDPVQREPLYEASLKVFCSTPDHGATCSDRCLAKGIGCVALAVHPYKPDGGVGKLFSCNDLMVGFMCGYHYPNGDDCYYPFSGFPFPKTCVYSGNN
jgi:hypothetical protein